MELPVDFVRRTRALLGKEYDCFEAALATEPPVSIRLNSSKGLPMPSSGEQISWSKNGYYLPERLTFTFDPLFHGGGYYVQEASSMFLEQAVKTYINKPSKCLDLCAAPGGKSTHLLDLLPEGSLLVSNEVIRNRSLILSENITKWGTPNVIVCNDDPERIGKFTHYFDFILADVPCSGEGMFRKDKNSRQEWSLSNVELCASRQKRIIHDIWDSLKPGGILVYSTCTYNTEENEENIHYLVNEYGVEVLPVPLQENWKVSGSCLGDIPVYRFFPHKTKGEGFFLAVLRKPEETMNTIRIKSKNPKDRKQDAIPEGFKSWLKQPEIFTLNNRNGLITAFPLIHQEDYSLLTSKIKVLSGGIRLGEVKGKDLIPDPALALSNSINLHQFSQTDVTWDEAINFLRKESITIDPNSPKGYHLITYRGLPLGFIKHLGNRSNNLYPGEWRIRTGYTPGEIKIL